MKGDKLLVTAFVTAAVLGLGNVMVAQSPTVRVEWMTLYLGLGALSLISAYGFVVLMDIVATQVVASATAIHSQVRGGA